MACDKKWLPLESNPEVMNKFLKEMGITEEWGFIDVINFDEEHLENIQSNVKAVLMLFPTGEKHDEHCQNEQENIESEGQVVSDRVYFLKLDQNNASGTASLIHAIANAFDDLPIADESILKEFIDRTKDMSAEERGQELEMEEGICCVHDSLAQEGQSEAPEADEDVNLHFNAFVNVDEQLYELDSRKSFPINHGSTTTETFLKDAVEVCKQFMERDPDNVNFSLMAFTQLPEAEEAAEEDGGDEEPAEAEPEE